MKTPRWLAALALATACGSDTMVTGEVNTEGGEICLERRRVCLVVPPRAVARTDLVRIQPSDDGPPAALGPTWDISPTSGERLTFLVPARVEFKLDEYLDAGVPSESLLRVYSFDEKEPASDWQALGNPRVDRVRGVIQGDTLHLSLFVVLRADLLPDGGVPTGKDAGPIDGGPDVIIPRCDGGPECRDAGVPDAGRPDAGPPDAGRPDAGPPDAGPPDAGPPDAGPPDAGPPDAGPPDAGPPDAGPPDAGPPDAGPPDAGPPDAGDGMDAGVDGG